VVVSEGGLEPPQNVVNRCKEDFKEFVDTLLVAFTPL
jgi:hypothetical protein